MIMKLTNVFAALAMVALASTACQNEPEAGLTPEQGAKVISVTPSFFSFNRATDTAFEEGDKIGLHIITDATYLNNALYTYTGGALSSATQNMWYKDEEQVADVVAYYPYSAQGAYTAEGYTFAVKNDQSVAGNYTASDLMIAHTTSKPTAEAVVLPFKHALSKIVVKVNNLSTATVENVYIANVYTSAVVDLKSGASTVEGELATIKGASIAAGEEQAWTMIVVPQKEATPKLVVTTSAGQFTFNITAATDLEAGKVASTTLTIDKELIPTDFTPEISDWEKNEDLEFNPSDENLPGIGEGDEPEGNEPETPEGGEVVTPEPEVKAQIYLNPWQWTSDNAWFAAYFWNETTNTWAKLTDDNEDGIYACEMPEGFTNVIFCRMNKLSDVLGWSDPNLPATDATLVWNQTEDLTIDGNMFTINSWNGGKDGKSSGTWSTQR